MGCLGVDQRDAAAWSPVRKIDRAQQLRGPLDEHQRFALIPGVIAAGDGVRAGIDELLIDRFGDAEAAGRVLAIYGDEIELPVADPPGQAVEQHYAPAAADNVADEEDSHALLAPDLNRLPLG
jgi:hypothetical protein